MTRAAAVVSRLVLLGPPASGKGTQGRRLAGELSLAYVSTGKQLRKEADRGSELGRRAARDLEAGRYVPDEVARDLALGWLEGVENGWVLDGFPRTVPQAEALDGFLGRDGETVLAILLDVAPAELERRLSQRRECSSCSWTGRRDEAGAEMRCPACGAAIKERADDSLENFRNRLRAFDELTGPVLSHYERSKRLRRVDGAGSPEEVFARVRRALQQD